MLKLLPAAVLVALALPTMAMADGADDITAIRKEMEAMRAAYEARLQALERRLQSAEAAMAAAPAASGAASATAAGPPAPVAAAPAASHCRRCSAGHRRRGRRRERVQPVDLADPLGPLHAHVARPGALRDQRLPAAAGRRDRAGHARLQPRRIRARLRGQHRPVAARRRQHRARTPTTRSRSRRPSCRRPRSATASR